MYHLLLRQDQFIVEKGKSLAIKASKGNGPSKIAKVTIICDDSNLDEKEMALIS